MSRIRALFRFFLTRKTGLHQFSVSGCAFVCGAGVGQQLHFDARKEQS